MSKTMETVKKVFATVVAVFAVAMMIFTVVSVMTFNRNDRNLLGFKAFIVLSDSMKATDFASGDVVIVKNVDPMTLQEGDIISYSSQNPENYGETVTHKIRAKTRDANGDPGFITYGTTTGVDDEIIVTFPYINGKYQFHIPKVGTFFYFLKSTPGYICCILIPFLLMIGMQGLNTIKLFRKYRREQLEEIEAQRASIEQEKQQSAAMMEEILRLKAQLAGGAAAVQEAAPAAEQPEASEEAKD